MHPSRTRSAGFALGLLLIASAALASPAAGAPTAAPSPAAPVPSATIKKGVLTITGTKAADHIDVQCQGGKVYLYKAMFLGDTDIPTTLDCTAVKSVFANMGGGGDSARFDKVSVAQGFTNFNGGVEVHGGTGNDALTGTTEADKIYGEKSNDFLIGNASHDLLSGGPGKDEGGISGHDPVATASHLTVTGDTDSISSIETADLFGDGAGNTIDATAFPGNAYLAGGAGADIMNGSPHSDTFDGLSNSDQMNGNGGNDSFDIGYGADTISGGPGTDRISTDANGTDITLTDASLLNAAHGTKTLSSIEAATLTSGTTSTAVTIDASGFSGSAKISGGSNTDTLIGGSGPDTIFTDRGDDTVDAGPGVDTLVYTNSANAPQDIVVGSGSLTVHEGATLKLNVSHTNFEKVTVNGSFYDNIITVSAFPGPATIHGGGGADDITGTTSNDHLMGDDGNDSISGLNGADVLVGGKQTDSCDGGPGGDTFKSCETTTN